MSNYAVGVDLGGTMIKAALVDESEGLLEQTSLETGAENGPAHIMDRIHEAVVEVSQDTAIEGIGIGSPGFISWDRTTVSTPRNLPHWDTVNVQEELQERMGSELPVIVENDANVAGLGSAFFGAGKPFESFIMVTLGTGVGGRGRATPPAGAGPGCGGAAPAGAATRRRRRTAAAAAAR